MNGPGVEDKDWENQSHATRPKGRVLDFLSQRSVGKPHLHNTSRAEDLAEEVFIKKDLKDKLCEIPGNPRSTFLVAFSPDGTLMASTHGDHCVYVTDIRTGKCMKKLPGHPRTPWCIAFHPSSNDLLASGCLAGQVRIWDLHGGSEMWSTEKPTVIASVAFHPSEDVLVIATSNEIHFWDWKKPKPFATCVTNSVREKVRYVKFDPTGRKLITGIANLACGNRGIGHEQQTDQPTSSTNPSTSRRHDFRISFSRPGSLYARRHDTSTEDNFASRYFWPSEPQTSGSVPRPVSTVRRDQPQIPMIAIPLNFGSEHATLREFYGYESESTPQQVPPPLLRLMSSRGTSNRREETQDDNNNNNTAIRSCNRSRVERRVDEMIRQARQAVEDGNTGTNSGSNNSDSSLPRNHWLNRLVSSLGLGFRDTHPRLGDSLYAAAMLDIYNRDRRDTHRNDGENNGRGPSTSRVISSGTTRLQERIREMLRFETPSKNPQDDPGEGTSSRVATQHDVSRKDSSSPECDAAFKIDSFDTKPGSSEPKGASVCDGDSSVLNTTGSTESSTKATEDAGNKKLTDSKEETTSDPSFPSLNEPTPGTSRSRWSRSVPESSRNDSTFDYLLQDPRADGNSTERLAWPEEPWTRDLTRIGPQTPFSACGSSSRLTTANKEDERRPPPLPSYVRRTGNGTEGRRDAPLLPSYSRLTNNEEESRPPVSVPRATDLGERSSTSRCPVTPGREEESRSRPIPWHTRTARSRSNTEVTGRMSNPSDRWSPFLRDGQSQSSGDGSRHRFRWRNFFGDSDDEVELPLRRTASPVEHRSSGSELGRSERMTLPLPRFSHALSGNDSSSSRQDSDGREDGPFSPRTRRAPLLFRRSVISELMCPGSDSLSSSNQNDSHPIDLPLEIRCPQSSVPNLPSDELMSVGNRASDASADERGASGNSGLSRAFQVSLNLSSAQESSSQGVGRRESSGEGRKRRRSGSDEHVPLKKRKLLFDVDRSESRNREEEDRPSADASSSTSGQTYRSFLERCRIENERFGMRSRETLDLLQTMQRRMYNRFPRDGDQTTPDEPAARPRYPVRSRLKLGSRRLSSDASGSSPYSLNYRRMMRERNEREYLRYTELIRASRRRAEILRYPRLGRQNESSFLPRNGEEERRQNNSGTSTPDPALVSEFEEEMQRRRRMRTQRSPRDSDTSFTRLLDPEEVAARRSQEDRNSDEDVGFPYREDGSQRGGRDEDRRSFSQRDRSARRYQDDIFADSEPDVTTSRSATDDSSRRSDSSRSRHTDGYRHNETPESLVEGLAEQISNFYSEEGASRSSRRETAESSGRTPREPSEEENDPTGPLDRREMDTLARRILNTYQERQFHHRNPPHTGPHPSPTDRIFYEEARAELLHRAFRVNRFRNMPMRLRRQIIEYLWRRRAHQSWRRRSSWNANNAEAARTRSGTATATTTSRAAEAAEAGSGASARQRSSLHRLRPARFRQIMRHIQNLERLYRQSSGGRERASGCVRRGRRLTHIRSMLEDLQRQIRSLQSTLQHTLPALLGNSSNAEGDRGTDNGDDGDVDLSNLEGSLSESSSFLSDSDLMNYSGDSSTVAAGSELGALLRRADEALSSAIRSYTVYENSQSSRSPEPWGRDPRLSYSRRRCPVSARHLPRSRLFQANSPHHRHRHRGIPRRNRLHCSMCSGDGYLGPDAPPSSNTGPLCHYHESRQNTNTQRESREDSPSSFLNRPWSPASTTGEGTGRRPNAARSSEETDREPSRRVSARLQAIIDEYAQASSLSDNVHGQLHNLRGLLQLALHLTDTLLADIDTRNSSLPQELLISRLPNPFASNSCDGCTRGQSGNTGQQQSEAPPPAPPPLPPSPPPHPSSPPIPPQIQIFLEGPTGEGPTTSSSQPPRPVSPPRPALAPTPAPEPSESNPPGAAHLLHPYYQGGHGMNPMFEDFAVQQAITSLISGPLLRDYHSAIITNTSMLMTHRIQVWDLDAHRLPDIADADANVLVAECKIHNDASVDMSKDGRLLATLVPSSVPLTTMLGIYSMHGTTWGHCLYMYRFGPNVVSLSLSPTCKHVLVGLASRRFTAHPGDNQVAAQIFRLGPLRGDDILTGDLEAVRDVVQGGGLQHVSVNSARWLPTPGQGLVFGTNRGHLKLLI